jgi:hypothetical protein
MAAQSTMQSADARRLHSESQSGCTCSARLQQPSGVWSARKPCSGRKIFSGTNGLGQPTLTTFMHAPSRQDDAIRRFSRRKSRPQYPRDQPNRTSVPAGRARHSVVDRELAGLVNALSAKRRPRVPDILLASATVRLLSFWLSLNSPLRASSRADRLRRWTNRRPDSILRRRCGVGGSCPARERRLPRRPP